MHLFLIRLPQLFCQSSVHCNPLLRICIWALFLIIVQSIHQLNVKARKSLLSAGGSREEKKSLKSKSNLPHTCQKTKHKAGSPLPPRVSSCSGPQPLPLPIDQLLHTSSSRGVHDGSRIPALWTYQEQTSVAMSVGTTQRAAGEPWGSPKNVQKGQGSHAPTSSLKASQGDPVKRST